MGCEHTRDVAAELALGIADGADRAQALRHLAECPECRRTVEELSAVADELLLLAPEHEPPPGFEGRVLARLGTQRRGLRGALARLGRRLTPGGLGRAGRLPAAPGRARRALVPVATGAAAAAIAVGVVLGATTDERRDAQHYRAALAAADGSAFTATKLHDPDRTPAGVVYAYRGRVSWIYVDLYADRRPQGYRVELALTSGRRLALPTFRLDPTTGSGGQAIPVDLDEVAGVRLVSGGDVLTATLPHD